MPAQRAAADDAPAPLDEADLIGHMEVIDASTELEDPSARKEEDVVQTYLDDMARKGRLVDDESVDTGVTSDGEVAAWDGDFAFDQVRVVTGTDQSTGDDVGVAIGLKTVEYDDGHTYGAVTGAEGLAMGGLTGAVNGEKKTYGCGTWTHSVGHKVTSCYEKWKVYEGSNTVDSWVYNRWGTAQARGDGLIHQYSVKELTLRSKPWSGTKSRVKVMSDYWPHDSSEVCPGSWASLGISVGPFSATLPQRCSTHDTFADGNTFELRTSWNGDADNTAGIDGAIALDTWAGETLVMADYFWADFSDEYNDIFGTYHIDHDKLWAYDSGW
jgi:hypothetical protein